MHTVVDAADSRWRLPGPGLVLAWMAGLAPTLALFAYKGMAPLMLTGTVLAALPGLRQRRWLAPLASPLAVVFLLLAVWSGLSMLWSISPADSWNLEPRLVAVLAAALVLLAVAGTLDAGQRRTVAAGLLVGLVVGAALIWLELLTDAAITRLVIHHESGRGALKPGSTVFALLVWPAVVALAALGRRWWAALLFLVLAIPLYLLDGKAAFLGLAVGSAVFALGWLLPRTTAVLLGLGIDGLSLTGPIWATRLVHIPAVLDRAPPSGHHRLFIWNFAAERILERPWLGWGLNTSRALPGGHAEVDPLTHGEAMPLHPHNGGLQLWLEIGLPGLLLGIAVVVLVLIAVLRHAPSRTGKAAGLATLATALVISDLSYGIWQNWWLCTFAVIACLLAITARLQPAAPASAGSA